MAYLHAVFFSFLICIKLFLTCLWINGSHYIVTNFLCESLTYIDILFKNNTLQILVEQQRIKFKFKLMSTFNDRSQGDRYCLCDNKMVVYLNNTVLIQHDAFKRPHCSLSLVHSCINYDKHHKFEGFISLTMQIATQTKKNVSVILALQRCGFITCFDYHIIILNVSNWALQAEQ